MRYLTDRKRAEGKGAARHGTEHHWYMQVSAVGLAFLVPTFLYIFGSALGGTRQEVLDTFSHPFAAILTALVLVVGMRHFAKGAEMMLQDYVRGTRLKISLIAVQALSYTIIATGLFALARIAL
ncbi:MAG: succinate dehydrogenase, hydrophobic membrane anchor protein [Rhodobacterales bacterium]|jgi:succinate dehydrogenase / fumarate reductase membrane anchor subunit|uniref:succinate dehydrogenase, hydrophobic membrane anchor protein n=1 Tax=Gemmobacter nectariphilus TaxID=220343 RepID=UPI000414D5BB|nr:succinate dehydrogenase, hydrophobic membrane anchor protein [Gemmobacter nectariphilus]MDX5358835.1 succinate dehydrogenase, hydrophobic membrane anchor protein [Rhodobacterales bacterium]MDX5501050.1 succinate dehydrogenase, hydrophobic membrane anchor protein [Rhodobacterales bacterium]